MKLSNVACRFFRNEYKLDHFLGTLIKPHVAILNGTVMGGGAGVSMHGTFRIATERCNNASCSGQIFLCDKTCLSEGG